MKDHYYSEIHEQKHPTKTKPKKATKQYFTNNVISNIYLLI